jgi:hypothetical protein
MQRQARILGIVLLTVAAIAATGCQGGENFDENYKQETSTTKEQRDAAMATKDTAKGPVQLDPATGEPTQRSAEPGTMKVPGKGGN